MLPAERKESERVIKSNKHELIVISFEEMDNVVKSLPPAKRKKVQSTWESIKAPASYGANYYTTATDIVKVKRLVRELGGFTTKVYIKEYGGKPHIILNGNHKLRTILTANRYGIKHPKLIKMGIGRDAVLGGVKSGGLISILLITVYRVLDYILTDEQTLFQFVGALAVDIVKIFIIVGVSALIAVTFGLTSIAIGSIVLVLAVGFVVGLILNAIDDRYDITKRVIAGLEELAENTPSLEDIRKRVLSSIDSAKDARDTFIDDRKREMASAAGHVAGSVIDYFIDSTRKTVIRAIRNVMHDGSNPIRRVY